MQVATIVYLDFACLSGVFSQDEPKSRGIGGPAYTGVGYFTGVSLCGWVCEGGCGEVSGCVGV